MSDVITKAIICSHNGEDYIEQQINSILGQTLEVSEIVVYDFNSGDSTRQVVGQLCERNPAVTLLGYDFAYGPAHSFLFAINHALFVDRRKFLLYIVDQDDCWKSNKNEVVVGAFLERSFDFCFHDVDIVDSNLGMRKNSYYGNLWSVRRDFKIPNQFFSNCVIGHTCSFDSDFLREINLNYDKRIPMHDWYLVNEGLVRGANFRFIEDQLSLYRQHDNNILGSERKGLGVIRGLFSYGSILSNYHNFIIEKHPSVFLHYNKQVILTVIKNVRPTRKLFYVLLAYLVKK
jgi:glycosyltransferase involved in cell wall biosynthesis